MNSVRIGVGEGVGYVRNTGVKMREEPAHLAPELFCQEVSRVAKALRAEGWLATRARWHAIAIGVVPPLPVPVLVQ
eukprot:SAG31_NODE_17041_length_685_cov_1.407850_1_plen_76_part_00